MNDAQPQDLEWVVSADGTRIGFERRGDGPPLVAVHGGTADRTRWAAIASSLAQENTLILMDRRGRGASEDAADGSYSLAAEAEDVAAVARAAGDGVVLLGHSYGAICALEAATLLDNLSGLVLYEPAYAATGHRIVEEDVFASMEASLAADDRTAALETFFREVIHLDAESIEAMKPTAVWAARLAAVHTLPREGRVAETYQPPERAGIADVPVLVLVGSESPEWLRAAAYGVHERIAHSELVELPGQGHLAMDTAPELFMREVLRFAHAPARESS